MLRKPGFERWVFLPESEITIFGCAPDILQNALLLSDESILKHDAEKPFKFGNLPVKPFEVVFFDHRQSAVFQCINKLCGRCLREQTIKIGSPPVLDGKLENVFVAFVIEVVVAQAAFQHKRFVATHFSFPQEKFFFLQMSDLNDRCEKPGLVGFEVNMARNIL